MILNIFWLGRRGRVWLMKRRFRSAAGWAENDLPWRGRGAAIPFSKRVPRLPLRLDSRAGAMLRYAAPIERYGASMRAGLAFEPDLDDCCEDVMTGLMVRSVIVMDTSSGGLEVKQDARG